MVSVIIPTYKRSDMLPETINSVLYQTYKDVEVIVVDDNNPDSSFRNETEKLIGQYASNKKVIYIKHAKNLNGSAARNTGLKVANGEFVCFLDDDDRFFKNKIEKQVDFLNNNHEYAAVCCEYAKNGVRETYEDKDDYTHEILLLEDIPQTSGTMFRKSAIDKIGGFDPSYIRHQDLELMLRFFDAGFKMGKINEILYSREISAISNVPDGKKFQSVKEKFLTQFDYIIVSIDKGEPGFKRKVYAIHYERIMKNYIKGKKLLRAFLFFAKAIAADPTTFVKEIKKEITIRQQK